MAENKEKVYNILLIGEIGIGKSTFINAFANYIHFPTFEDAMKAKDPKVLIPARFEITDEDGTRNIIKVGKDEDECDEEGQSGTQRCKLYTFRSDSDVVIRFIDSPGVADTRGIERDEANLAHMVDFLGKFEYINAILIILPPDNARLTALFNYSIKRLLGSLEKGAVNNIVFLFNRCRGTDYRPGSTMELLRKVIADIRSKPPGINIPLRSNIFCVENDTFKYLLASSLGSRLKERIIKECSNSWCESVGAIERLLQYIANRDPHSIKNSVSLVKARTAIRLLSKPLADIAHFIDANVDRIENCLSQLSENEDLKLKLERLLFKKRIDMRIRELDRPMNVCTHRDCIELDKIVSSNIVHYKSECHRPCGLRGVKISVKGDNRMRYCFIMDKKGSKKAICRKCEHHYSTHMHIDYKIEMNERKIINEKVKTSLEKNQIDTAVIEEALNNYSDQKQKYQQEESFITNAVAKFAVYLKNSAIVSYNDAYEEYLYHEMNSQDNDNGPKGNRKKHYEERIKTYKEQQRILEENWKKCEPEKELTGTNVMNTIEDIFKLELSGNYIKQMYGAAFSHASTETHEKIMEVHTNEAKTLFNAIKTAAI